MAKPYRGYRRGYVLFTFEWDNILRTSNRAQIIDNLMTGNFYPKSEMQLTATNMQSNIIFRINFSIVRRSDSTIWLILEIKHLPVSNIFYVGYGSPDVCHIPVSASHLHKPPVIACIFLPYTPRIHLFFTKLWSNYFRSEIETRWHSICLS